MNILVVYDSEFGNTGKIAKAMAEDIQASAQLVNDVEQEKIQTYDLLIVGAPTQGGMPTDAVKAFIKDIRPEQLKTTAVAVFDTRFGINDHGKALKLLMKTIGFASPKMAKQFKEKGIKTITEPAGFIVNDKEGPLQDGELERAKIWARGLVQALS